MSKINYSNATYAQVDCGNGYREFKRAEFVSQNDFGLAVIRCAMISPYDHDDDDFKDWEDRVYLFRYDANEGE